MQPTYLPWLGYFDLMDQADVFVLYDDVQFDKRSWQQRNRIKSQDKELILTVPVSSKGKYHQKINQVEIISSENFADNHLKSISLNYRKSKYFDDYFPSLESIYKKNHRLLVELNQQLIDLLAKQLGIDTVIVVSSSYMASGIKADRLISLCTKLRADEYLSPAGAQSYLTSDSAFKQNDIKLRFQDYHHPIYTQQGDEFIPYLSVLDLLFNHGPKSLAIIRSGRVS